MDRALLQDTIERLTRPRMGILAADESTGTITKRLSAVGVESTEETRRAYRTMLFTAPAIGNYLAGVILFEETLGQKADDGTPLVEILENAGIVPGIKVDKGTVDLPSHSGEKFTQGLDGLGERLDAFREQGARFAKWRAVYAIGDGTPSRAAYDVNARALAMYAALCQQHGLVPIVEPEVLMDGDHGIEGCAEATEAAQHALYHALAELGVSLEHTILKPNMVHPGKDSGSRPGPEEIAAWTLRVLKRTTPAAVPSINFLSGGQSPEEATANLAAMNRLADASAPWILSFSYARALQGPAMEAWAGRAETVSEAQRLFARRAELASLARAGEYEPAMEAA